MDETAFKISIIDAGININKLHSFKPHKEITDIVREIKLGSVSLISYDYEKAIKIGEIHGFDIFAIEGNRQQQLRNTLKLLMMNLRPFWAQITYLGRERVKRLLDDDQLQCFHYADLFSSSPSEEVVDWWEEVGEFFRKIDKDKKIELGRQGEKRTIALERKRLMGWGILQEPEWIAFEDSTAGFDVLSYRKHEKMELRALKIEVKSCSYSPTHFILTRNEWDTAKSDPNNYIFQIWNFDNDSLTEMSVEEVALHIPQNNGNGEWKELEIYLDE